MNSRHILFVLPVALGALAGCTDKEDDTGATTSAALPDCPDDVGAACIVAGTGFTGYSGDGGDARLAYLYRPMDVAARPGNGDFVLVDWNNHRLRLVDENYTITTIMGSDIPGDGPDDQSDRDAPGAPGTTVKLNHPVQVEWRSDGMLYLPAWHNHKIRTWDPATGMVIVIAGDVGFDTGNGANGGFSGDGGPAEDALLFFPNSLVFDASGGYYFADQKNLRIRHVDSSDIINTVVGDGVWGYEDASQPAEPNANPLLNEEFAFVDTASNPQPEPGSALEIDASGNLYVADSWNNRIRYVDFAAQTITDIAGTGTAGYSGDGGDALQATLNQPRDIELGLDGALYVADTANHVVRRIDLAAGTISTVAGTGVMGMGASGVQATQMDLNYPYGVDVDEDGALLIADTFNSRILRVNP